MRLISAMNEPGGAFGVAYESMDSSSVDESEDDLLLSSCGSTLIVDGGSCVRSKIDRGGSGGGSEGVVSLGGVRGISGESKVNTLDAHTCHSQCTGSVHSTSLSWLIWAAT